VKRRTERLSCCWVELGGWESWRLDRGIVVSGNFLKQVLGHCTGKGMQGLKQMVAMLFMFCVWITFVKTEFHFLKKCVSNSNELMGDHRCD